MKQSFRAGTPLDIQDVYARFTLDSATEFLFGDCVHSIHEPMLLSGGVTPSMSGKPTHFVNHPSSSAFVRAFSASQELLSKRLRLGLVWPILEMFEDKSDEYTDKLKAYLQPIVDVGLQRRPLLNERQESGKTGKEIDEDMTLLDHLVLETDDVNIIRDELMNMLIAGRDTVSTMVRFLSKNHR